MSSDVATNWEDRQIGGSRFAGGSAIIRPEESQ
jgi:hypothetical protein